MLCSKCSATVKPIVAIDIDGTLGDYHSHFLNFAEQYMGVTPGMVRRELEYDGAIDFKEWFCSVYAVDITTFRQIKLAYRQGGMKRTMPVYQYASELVGQLRIKWGAEVWLTTTRPYLRLDQVDPDTREWLRRSMVYYDGLLYDEDKYQRLLEIVERGRVVAVLDDLMEQHEAAARAFGPTVPILRRQTYNRNAHPARGWYAVRAEARTLPEAYELIKKRIQRWREDHDG